MSALLKNCCCIMFGGGVCAVPFLNFSSPSINSGGSFSNTQTPHSSGTRDAGAGNCSINSEIDKVFDQYPDMSYNYISFSCDSNGNDDPKINLNWKIWMPIKHVKSPSTFFSGNKKISIKTRTTGLVEDLDDVYDRETRFESNDFNAPIIGKWGKNSFAWGFGSDEELVYKVKVSDSEDDPIFLKLNQ